MAFRYEYKIMKLGEMSERHLNFLALRGWRLIAVTPPPTESLRMDTTQSTFYLEREYEAKESDAEQGS